MVGVSLLLNFGGFLIYADLGSFKVGIRRLRHIARLAIMLRFLGSGKQLKLPASSTGLLNPCKRLHVSTVSSVTL